MIFTRTSSIVGVAVDTVLTEEGVLESNSLCPAIEDTLDRMCIPWANVNKSEFKFASKTVNGEVVVFFLVQFELTDPLPRVVADKLGKSMGDFPGKNVVCYGGSEQCQKRVFQ